MATTDVLLLVFEVATLLGEGNKVGEDHAADAYVEEGLHGASLDVLLNIAIHHLIGHLLDVLPCEFQLQASQKIQHLHALDLIVECPHLHGHSLRAPRNPNPNPSLRFPRSFNDREKNR